MGEAIPNQNVKFNQMCQVLPILSSNQVHEGNEGRAAVQKQQDLSVLHAAVSCDLNMTQQSNAVPKKKHI